MTVDPETVASIDTVEAVHYARGLGEAIAAFYQAMLDGGLPPHLACEAVAAYVEMRIAPAYVQAEDEEDE